MVVCLTLFNSGNADTGCTQAPDAVQSKQPVYDQVMCSADVESFSILPNAAYGTSISTSKDI